MLGLAGIKPHNINAPNKPLKRKIVRIVTPPKSGGCGCGK
jgi:hypothetical protein